MPMAHSERGFTLIEVLIALVVISVGLLGMASLSLHTMKANRNAFTLSQADTLAYSMLDDMRANRQAALNGSYDISLTANTPSSTPSVALQDIAHWRQILQKMLPDGTGSVSVTGNHATVVVQWSAQANALNRKSPSVETVTEETVL